MKIKAKLGLKIYNHNLLIKIKILITNYFKMDWNSLLDSFSIIFLSFNNQIFSQIKFNISSLIKILLMEWMVKKFKYKVVNNKEED